MKANYLCPHCKSIINVEDDLILVSKNKDNLKGIIILHTELGNYESRKSSDFIVNEKETIDFYCPICAKNLESKIKRDLVSVIMIDEFNKESMIFFSKIYKNKCTYHIIDKEVFSYGESAKKFSNPEWFL